MDQHGIQAPLLSLERQILLEEEVTTPPRGGRPAPETQVPPGGAQAVPQILQRSVHELVVQTDRRMLDRR